MTPSEPERRQQLRRARWKLDECQIAAEKHSGDEHPRGEREWHDLVELRIQEAMSDGVFDNLPGEGQPLDLSRNPYLDPSLELAYRLLKNNGYTPEWIARDKEIREELKAARARLQAAWAQRRVNPTDKTAWEAVLVRFEENLTRLNRKIDDYNLIVPISGCQRVRLRLADELSRLHHE